MAPPRPHHVASGVKTMSEATLTIYPKDLNIIWGNDNRYWQWPPEQTSAVLAQVCWLEVNGIVNVKPGRYKITFSVSLKPDSFGWNACKPYVMAKVGKRVPYSYKAATLPLFQTPEPIVLPNGGGLEIVADAKEGSDVQPLHFGLYEIWSGKWKGGLIIHHATIEKLQ